MFEKHLNLFILTKLILRRYTKTPDRCRQAYHTWLLYGDMPLILRTASLRDAVLYKATNHNAVQILRPFSMESWVLRHGHRYSSIR